MKQIITGPFGRVAYHNAAQGGMCQYPALNMPSLDFARGESLVAANDAYAANVVPMVRQMGSNASVAMFGMSANR